MLRMFDKQGKRMYMFVVGKLTQGFCDGLSMYLAKKIEEAANSDGA